MEKQFITKEEIVMALLLEYKKEITSSEIKYFFQSLTDYSHGKYELLEGDFNRIINYIDYDGEILKFKDTVNLDAQAYRGYDQYTVRRKLTIIAGSKALGYVIFLKDRGCLNCVNGTCRIPYKEKTGLDEYGFPEGNRCIGWKNDSYEEKILSLQ